MMGPTMVIIDLCNFIRRRCCHHLCQVQVALLPLLLSSGLTTTNMAQRRRLMIMAEP